jgi:hypothetical protein
MTEAGETAAEPPERCVRVGWAQPAWRRTPGVAKVSQQNLQHKQDCGKTPKSRMVAIQRVVAIQHTYRRCSFRRKTTDKWCEDQIRSDQIRSDQIRSDQISSDQIR